MNEFSGRPNAAKVQLNELLDQKGKPASPTLPAEIKNYLIDIDGTITEDVPNEDPERMATCLPFPDALETLNRWHADGHIITFFTSRTEEHRAVTEAWFDKHGFLYHGLLMGKPRGGNYHWVDNHIVRATRYEGTFSDLVRENAEIEVFKKG
ncbi:phosphoheptose isomerase [Flavobacteriales bacterium]|nr:phosphoheptose isomerase [Flavobacteriales bacterium]